MKYALLSVSSESGFNIGDYIQALASSQFLPCVDFFIQREKIKSYADEEVCCIMNGWYMHHSEEWPPSCQITPLFVAFHLNSQVANKLLSTEGVKYLNSHAPIGCRDYHTVEKLQDKGINAYFSGCMTLTLGQHYKAAQRGSKVYFVDPYFRTDWTFFTVVSRTFYLILKFYPLWRIAFKYPAQVFILRKMMILTAFYKEYSKYFSKETLLQAEYIAHENKIINSSKSFDNNCLNEAENLVRQYAAAALVVTSRIHCALPCLGLETPVIYTDHTDDSEASQCRMSGLKELFHVMTWDKGKLKFNFPVEDKITARSGLLNKNTWQPLAKKMIEMCTSWIKKNQTRSNGI